MELSSPKLKKLLYISAGNFPSSKKRKTHSEKISYIFLKKYLKNYIFLLNGFF